NVDHCADLKVRSSGEFSQVNEVFSLQKSEAPILELAGTDRAVIQVKGWERFEYSVEACKVAVAETRAGAEQAVRNVHVARSAGRISAAGPAGDDSQWQIFFIIRTPKDANLNIETKNGPISLSGVWGTAKVRATNGPVSLNDSNGTMEVRTENGPISFNGGSGEAHLIAQNGPISLNLAGDFWNGTKLEAKTVNGPVSVTMPETFRSGLRLETSRH